MTVVITGAAGLVGSVLLRELPEGLDVVGVDRRWRRPRGIRRADLTSLASARRAVRGAGTVIDLAARPEAETPWAAVHDTNIRIAVNVLEAARLEGVRRVILASSNHVTGLYEKDEPYASVVAGRYDGLDPRTVPRIRATDPIRPDGFYAIGKVLAEAAGRFYSEEHGLSVICLRIGTVNRAGAPTNPRHFATLLSHRDLANLVLACLRAPSATHHGVFYGVSRNTWRIWDIDDAAAVLGYAPQDDAERWR